MDVELDDLLRGVSAAVGYLRRNLDVPIRSQRRRIEGQVRIGDLPVSEPVTEGIARAVGNTAEVSLVRLEVAGRVGPASGLVRIIIRLLPRLPREACDEARRRAVGAEQDIGDRIAGLRAEEPGG